MISALDVEMITPKGIFSGCLYVQLIEFHSLKNVELLITTQKFSHLKFSVVITTTFIIRKDLIQSSHSMMMALDM